MNLVNILSGFLVVLINALFFWKFVTWKIIHAKFADHKQKIIRGLVNGYTTSGEGIQN